MTATLRRATPNATSREEFPMRVISARFLGHVARRAESQRPGNGLTRSSFFGHRQITKPSRWRPDLRVALHKQMRSSTNATCFPTTAASFRESAELFHTRGSDGLAPQPNSSAPLFSEIIWRTSPVVHLFDNRRHFPHAQTARP